MIKPPDGSSGGYPGGPHFDSLSWSPDDSSLAYEYNATIYVASIASLTNCSADTINQVISTGSDPYWGPASVNPPPRPPPPPPPPPLPPPPPPPPPPKHCYVPHLAGDKLAKARKVIASRGCKLGKVTRRHASRKKRGRVIAQSLKPGLTEAVGTRVNIVIGR